jgi:hypothetical protein
MVHLSVGLLYDMADDLGRMTDQITLLWRCCAMPCRLVKKWLKPYDATLTRDTATRSGRVRRADALKTLPSRLKHMFSSWWERLTAGERG